MCTYVACMGDHLLGAAGMAAVWGAKNPFDFMQLISLSGKSNFFERKVSEYSKANVRVGAENSQGFAFVVDEMF